MVRILHTADWHVGKTIKGHSRLDEHRAVLADLVRLADAERVDVVAIAGDLYETAAPGPDAEALVLRTLLDLRDTGAHVVVIAGNHDHAARFDAVRPVFAALGVTVAGAPRRREDGGVLELTTAAGDIRVALLPFCSQRGILRAQQLLELDAAQLAATYDERMRRVVDALCAGFAPDAVNVVVGHCLVAGAAAGGGERAAQTFGDYAVGAVAFPSSATYVALGHLHRTQSIPAAAPVWYSGSPIQVDFGERDEPAHALLVEASPGLPAQVRPVEVRGGRRLRTVRGTYDEVVARADEIGDDLWRVLLAEVARAGLADDVRRELGPGAVEVRVEASADDRARVAPDRVGAGATPHDLFHRFLEQEGVADPRVEALFARLLDEETG